MTSTRRYESPKRDAQAAATRNAILEAFVEQLSEPGRDDISPSDAAVRAGVSLRTVHTHFPNRDSQIAAIAEWIDRYTYPNGVVAAQGPDDLARYYRDVHAMALASPLTRALLKSKGTAEWQAIREQRRSERLEAIRRAVERVGAPQRETDDATAMLLSLAGADASLPLHDVYGLPLDRVPDVIANTVQLIIDQLRQHAANAARVESESGDLPFANNG